MWSKWVGRNHRDKDRKERKFTFRSDVLVAVGYVVGSSTAAKTSLWKSVAFFKLCQVYSTSPKNVKCTQISLGLIPWGPYLRKERKIRRRFFASFLKREIRHFHVAIVHGDGKEVTYRKAWFTCKVVILLVWNLLLIVIAVVLAPAKTPCAAHFLACERQTYF